MNDLIFKGKIDETEVGKIKEGMPIVLTVGTLSSDKFDARPEYISPKGLEENGAVLFEIKAAMKVPDTVFIRAGYSANAEIVLARASDVPTIPESSVEFSNDSAFVYKVKEGYFILFDEPLYGASFGAVETMDVGRVYRVCR